MEGSGLFQAPLGGGFSFDTGIGSRRPVDAGISFNPQDPRFDFPVVGEKTLINLRKAKINGLALFENRLILLNKEKLIKLADELDLFIFVVK